MFPVDGVASRKGEFLICMVCTYFKIYILYVISFVYMPSNDITYVTSFAYV